jgi:4-hydroxybenzoate polyprenyltransferase
VDASAAPRKRFDVVAYLKLFRFPLVFTAIADSLAGHLLSRHVQWGTIALLAVTSAGLYFFGMGLNDLADREKDRQSAPGRVLPSGRLSLGAARTAVMLALLASLTANLLIGRQFLVQRLVLWGAVAACICAYNLFLKIPPVMGLVRAFNLLLGISSGVLMGPGAFGPAWAFVLTALPAFVYVSSLTYVSTLEDAEIERSKVFFGGAFMVISALLAATVGPIWLVMEEGVSVPTGLGYAIHRLSNDWHGLPFAALLAAWTLRRAAAARDKKGVMLMVRDGVGGIIVLDAALVAAQLPLAPALLVAALVLPAAASVALFKRLA